MSKTKPASCTLAIVALLLVVTEQSYTNTSEQQDTERPSLSLRVRPELNSGRKGLVRASLEIRGGSDNYEEFYCPALEWEWGDDTFSEAKRDCEPYEPGKSSIQRWFRAQHTYHESGVFKVILRLKKRDRVVGLASSNIQIRQVRR
tara:strand:+ start:1511 stop:1948 length:438 start_codon:yes stop_codon:yes gene_type:complete